MSKIWVEKPVCLHEREEELLLAARKKYGARIQVGHVVRFTGAYKYLKEAVESGIYAAIVAGHFSRISGRPVWMKGYDDRKGTGTMALDLHIHDADFIRYLMNGETDKTEVCGTRNKEGIIQHLWSSYRYGDAVLVAEASWDYSKTYPFAVTFRVKLKKAAITLDSKGVLMVYPEQGEAFAPKLEKPVIKDMGINVSDMGPYLSEIKYFLELIEEERGDGIPSLEEAVASFRMVKKEMEILED